MRVPISLPVSFTDAAENPNTTYSAPEIIAATLSSVTLSRHSASLAIAFPANATRRRRAYRLTDCEYNAAMRVDETASKSSVR